MGTVITGDEWLMELALQGEPQRKVAGRLLRMQVLTHNRTGHIVSLAEEQVRRSIVHASRYGSVARVIARCTRCGWSAWLSDWCRGATYAMEERVKVIQELYNEKYPQDTCFLRACPGEDYARDIRDIVSLPRNRGV